MNNSVTSVSLLHSSEKQLVAIITGEKVFILIATLIKDLKT
jgi:hypothetical protein